MLKLSKVLNTSVAYIMGETLSPEAVSLDGCEERARDDGAKTAYSLSAYSPRPFSISIERNEKGKTVRYDLPPDIAEMFFSHIEQLWQKIEKEMEARR